MDCTYTGAVALTFEASSLDLNTLQANLPPYRMRIGTSARNTPIKVRAATGPDLGNRNAIQTEAITDKPFLADLRKAKRLILFIERDTEEPKIISIPFNSARLTKFFESCGI